MNSVRRIVLVFLALAISPGVACGESLGRLFFTPEERAQFEQLRWAEPVSEDSAVVMPPSVVPGVMPDENSALKKDSSKDMPVFVTLGGVVKRGQSLHTLWLNGNSYVGGALPSGVRVVSPATAGQVEVLVLNRGRSYALRPGQTLELDTGVVREANEQTQVQMARSSDAAAGPPAGESCHAKSSGEETAAGPH